MAEKKHLDLIRQGIEVWNKWRNDNPEICPDLSGANLAKVDLSSKYLDHRRMNLSRANLTGADLSGAILGGSDVSFANLRGANLVHANLIETTLRGADLSGAYLTQADCLIADFHGANLSHSVLTSARFIGADLSFANLSNADLSHTTFVIANLSNANLAGAFIYGISVWDVNLDGANQSDLVIEKDFETITVDNIEVAQFIYLLLDNQKIRKFIDSITSKAVLILGRFTPERKIVLNSIRDALRAHNFLPILFDFTQPSSRNLTETISTLAHISSFVIADVTDAKSIPQELQSIVPHLPSLPIQTLLQTSEPEYGMFKDFLAYPWVLAPYHYQNVEDLLASLEDKVILPAITKLKENENKRNQ